MRYMLTILSSCFLAGGLLLLVTPVFGQACNCPTPTNCAPCLGGLSGMTLRYTGPLAVTVTVSDQGGIVYTGALVTPGTEFSFVGSNPLDKFIGPNITISVNALPDQIIGTQCNDGAEVGSVYGNFTVVALVSKNNGTICCPVAITDNMPPVISGCPLNLVQPASTSCTAVVTWAPPTATDDCTLASLTTSHAPGSIFPIGNTNVVYTATDAYGNTSTCSFQVSVTDTTPPLITGCPANINLFAAANCKATATWLAPIATDNCAVQTLTGTHTSGTEFSLGSTTVTYTATDAAGNSSTCSFTVNVTDNTPPLIDGCPTTIHVFAAANCKAIVNWTAPASSDNCVVQTFTSTHAPGSQFDLGSTTVTYTATDAAGNISTCSFTVNVTDNTPPVITSCPANINISAAANCKALVNWTAPTASDNCAVQTFTSTKAPGSQFDLGSTTVTYTATDAAGNIATCSFTVNVTDNTPPVIAGCPSTIHVFASANCKAIVNWTSPTASDNCSVQTFTSTHAPGSQFDLGSTTVTYTATDAVGNTSTCSFTVNVTDNTPPVITSCPANINISAAANCKALVNWTAPTASDNCAVQTFTSTHAPNSEFVLGSTTVTYTATDAAGNSATCSFVVNVADNTPPIITGCPANLTIQANPNCKAFASWTTPMATDNCSTASLSASYSSGSEFDVGTTVVTYTALDNAGNQSTCTFNVIVTNNQTISVTGCPSDIELYADETGSAEVNWVEPVFAVNCGTLEVQRSAAPGRFQVGQSTVKYLATDQLNNTSTCSFSVTVLLREVNIRLSQLVTPDGDGYNDTWKIFEIDQYPDNEVIVYDRWGSAVFKTQKYNNESNAWDGTRSGNPLPSGTYFYRILITYGNRSTHQEGFIELVQ
jgi:gliding motility-associated-like protein